MQVARDRQFGAALVAAPLFWTVLLPFWPTPPDPSWPVQFPLRFLLLALVYPVLEEATFRGLLQSALHTWRWGHSRYWGLSGANLATTLAFAASHLVWHDMRQSMAVVVPGLVFGYFRDRYGRIAPSVMLHIVYNTGFALLFVAPRV